MSRSASKVSSAQKDLSVFKNRRAASVDTRFRGSYVPEKRRPSSEERKSGNSSCNRWSGARKNSMNLSEAKRKDTRPLTDKSYQKRKICDLVRFLEENGFKYPITVGKLSSPSRKDFENIFQFLYNYFDPTYEVKKIEEEAPKILKNLGYPFTINKSAFVYVARTNWPNLLGALIWLMDLNKFALQITMNSIFDSEGDGEKAEINSILLHYIFECHHSGTDDEEQENAMFTQIIKSSMKDDVDELMAKNKEKKLLLESVEKELSEIKDLAEQKDTLQKNIEKYEDYIAKMKSHYQKANESHEKLLAELHEKESELNSLQEDVSKQQDLYDAQGFDGKKQLNYFETQKKELTDVLDKKRSDFRELQDRFWEAEIQFKQNLDKATAALESFTELYNTRIEEARIVLHPLQSLKNPQVQKLCNSYHVEFPSWEILPTKSQPDWSSIHKNVLESISDKLQNTDELFKRVLSSQNEKLSEIQTKKSDLAMQLKLLHVTESHSESDINLKEKQAVDEISSLEVMCEKLSESIKNIQSERLNLEKTYRRMTEELKHLIAHREKMQKDLQAYLLEQQSMFEAYSKDEEKVAELISESGSEILQALEDLKKLKD